MEPCDLIFPSVAFRTISCSGRLPISVSGGDTHRASIMLTKRPSTSIPSNTQVMLSLSSRQGPVMSTAVPPKTWPERGAISSVTVSRHEGIKVQIMASVLHNMNTQQLICTVYTAINYITERLP